MYLTKLGSAISRQGLIERMPGWATPVLSQAAALLPETSQERGWRA